METARSMAPKRMWRSDRHMTLCKSARDGAMEPVTVRSTAKRSAALATPTRAAAADWPSSDQGFRHGFRNVPSGRAAARR